MCNVIYRKLRYSVLKMIFFVLLASHSMSMMGYFPRCKVDLLLVSYRYKQRHLKTEK